MVTWGICTVLLFRHWDEVTEMLNIYFHLASRRGGNWRWYFLLRLSYNAFWSHSSSIPQLLPDPLPPSGPPNLKPCFTRDVKEAYKPRTVGGRPGAQRDMERGDRELLIHRCPPNSAGTPQNVQCHSDEGVTQCRHAGCHSICHRIVNELLP